METLTETAALAIPGQCEQPGTDLLQCPPAAMLEFQASLQLLLQRACFLTAASSAAVAIEEDGEFVYCVVIGESGLEVGAIVNLSKPSIARCLQTQKPLCMERGASGLASLTFPIVGDAKVTGLFELSGEADFEARDLEALGRLAEMVNTALEHREAAAQVENGTFAQLLQETCVPAPRLWHAPELAEPDLAETESSQQGASVASSSATANIEKCVSCGFPVSSGRKLCIDCEQKTETVREPAELFTTPEHESWMSAYGYAIASLLVTAAAAAILLWLR